MAAPEGNQFWKKRATHGRNRIFKTPNALWKAACEYFDWSDSTPLEKNEVVKSGDRTGDILVVPVGRPYSLKALCIFLHTNSGFWTQFKSGLTESKTLTHKQKEDFSSIISQIEEIIYTQKFEGAVVGVFNPSVISRELGLAEKVDSTTKNTNTNVNYNVELSKQEIRDIDKALEEEY